MTDSFNSLLALLGQKKSSSRAAPAGPKPRKLSLSKAAALFQAPLAQAVRTVAALQDKREKDSGSAPADD